MDVKDIINTFEDIIIQIATPYSTGTGFYLKAYDLIITNEHVVRGNKSVVIDGKLFSKQITDILFLDSKYDLAFLAAPVGHDMPDISLCKDDTHVEGDKIIAIGHPFDLKYTVTQGIISSLLHREGDIEYIQHDAALNPGNSGGPLVNSDGNILGINTFIIRDGHNLGFSLPYSYIKNCLEAYLEKRGSRAVRCISCTKIIFEEQKPDMRYCPTCGAKIQTISSIESYAPYGISHTVEDMITKLGYNVGLTRKGPNSWAIKKGSAVLNISYYEKTGLLVGDVYLCLLPEDHIEELYIYLLHQNYTLEGLTFSVKDQDIILSLLIYDQYLHVDTMHKLFDNLLTKADTFDNVLVEKFKAKWKS